MMRRYRYLLLPAFLIFLATPGANAGEIVAAVAFVPAPTPSLAAEAVLVPLNPQALLVKKGPDAWSYQFATDADLYQVLSIRFSTPPQPYTSDALSLRLPFFFAEKSFDVTIAGTKGDAGVDDVRSLYATSVTDMRPRDLFVFFQRARFIAGARIRRVENQFPRTSAYDVQAVFKFLESARELSLLRYLAPDTSVEQAREWLRTAATAAPKIAIAGVGATQIKQIVEQIDQLDGLFFGSLFANIKPLLAGGPEPRMRGCRLIANYKSSLSKMPDDQRDAVLKAGRLDLALVETAVTSCLLDSKVSPEKLRLQSAALEVAKAKAATDVSRKLVESAISVLAPMIK